MQEARKDLETIGALHWYDGGAPPFDETLDDEGLAWAPEVPGICGWKLCSNDGWLVTPVECAGAWQAWQAYKKDQIYSPVCMAFEEFMDYICDSVNHGGFRVY